MTTRLVVIVVLLMVFTILLLNLDRVTTRFGGSSATPVGEQQTLSNDQYRSFIDLNLPTLCKNTETSMTQETTVLLQPADDKVLAMIDGTDSTNRTAKCQVSFDKYDVNKYDIVSFDVDQTTPVATGTEDTGMVTTGADITGASDATTVTPPTDTATDSGTPTTTPPPSDTTAPTDTTTATSADVNVATAPSDVAQIPTTAKTLTYTTNKGYSIIFPKKDVTYAAQSWSETFGYPNVSCNTQVKVDLWTPTNQEVTDSKFQIYTCVIKGDDPTWAQNLIVKKLDGGPTFIIQVSDPAWTTIANNVSFALASTGTAQ